MRIRIGMLLRHPPVHQGTRTPRTAQMLHSRRMRMLALPPRQLNQWLVLLRLLALEAVHPRQPPVSTLAFFIPAHVALVTFDISHSLSPPRETITLPLLCGQRRRTRPNPIRKRLAPEVMLKPV